MPDYGHPLAFAANLSTTARDPEAAIDLARTAEASGLDLLTVQDHPYNTAALDAWTLLSYLAARTSTIRLVGNVHPLPLRPAVTLARSAASLDRLSGGRIELGLGAGGYLDAIEREGGPRLTPGTAVDALEEGIRLIREVWDVRSGEPLRFEGAHYAIRGRRGPRSAHQIGIWLGAYGPRMLRLTGRLADGWLPSLPMFDSYRPLAEGNAVIDDAAVAAGRSPRDVLRLLNLGEPLPAEALAELALEYGTSVFTLLADDERLVRWYGEELAPAVRELVAKERGTAPV